MQPSNIDESINLAGISSLISSDGGADIREIERSLVEQTEQLTVRDVSEDVAAEFRKRLSSMESAIGMALTNDSSGGGDNENDDDDDDDDAKYDETPRTTAGKYPGVFSPNERPYNINAGREDASTSAPADHRGSYGLPQYRPNRHSSDPYFANMSNEQRKQRILQDALNNINTRQMSGEEKFNLETEKMNETKNLLLEQINMLRTSLEDDDIKISDVRVVTAENTFEEVEGVFNQLRYRNDHARYSGLAKELADMAASGLEWAFDGKKTYFGTNPDLTGWGATLHIKMRRLRYETSRIVSDCMDSYNLGNVSRLCLELIPSMIIHSRMRASRVGRSANRPSDAEYANAISRIRDKSDIKRDNARQRE